MESIKRRLRFHSFLFSQNSFMYLGQEIKAHSRSFSLFRLAYQFRKNSHMTSFILQSNPSFYQSWMCSFRVVVFLSRNKNFIFVSRNKNFMIEREAKVQFISHSNFFIKSLVKWSILLYDLDGLLCGKQDNVNEVH